MRQLTLAYPSLTLYEAENIYQDTFLAVHDNLQHGRVKADTNWAGYIMKIGLNLAAREMRHRALTTSLDSEDPQGHSIAEKLQGLADEEYTTLSQDAQAQAVLGRVLAHIPEPCASIIRLFYYEMMRMDQIAAETGYKNAQTAKARKNQCMHDLVSRVKEALGQAGIID